MQSSASAVQLLEFILRVKQLLLQYPPAAGTWHLLPPLRQHPLLPQLRQHQPQRCVPEVLSLKSAISCHYDVQIPLVLLHFCTQTVFLVGFDVQADDDDLDLFGEETEDEAAAAAEREASKKAAGAKRKESKSFFSLRWFLFLAHCVLYYYVVGYLCLRDVHSELTLPFGLMDGRVCQKAKTKLSFFSSCWL